MNSAELPSQLELSLPARLPYYLKILRISVIISLVITILSAISFPFLQPVIPLFYSVSQPSQQLAPKIWIFLFPIFAWLITLSHFFLLRNMKDIEGSVERIFSWTTLGIVVIGGLMFIRVVLLVL
jgi:hypothetical protein